MTLQDIYSKYQHLTDKGTTHSYILLYQALFPMPESVSSVLEIGVQTGGSLLMWREFFENANIHGIDISPNPFPDPVDGITFHRVNVLDKPGMDMELDGTKSFDVIIDDGSHILLEQLTTLEYLWPRLSAGGLYCVEDVIRPQDIEKFRRKEGSFRWWDFSSLSRRYDDRMVVLQK